MIPAVGIGYAVQNPSTPYIVFLILALLCGLGGGNFASSMANISFFFPKSEKGNALALNAGLGNLGVSVVQFLVPIAITVGVFGWLGGEPVTTGAQQAPLWLQNAGFIWVPFIAASAFICWFGYERHRLRQGIVQRAGGDLSAQAQLADVLALYRNIRLVHRLLGRLPAAGQDPVPCRRCAAIRLPGSADRCPVALGHRLGVRQIRRRPRHLLGLHPDADRRRRRPLFPRHQDQPSAFWGFFAMFLVLFFATGVGNASTFQMIPNFMRSEIDRLMPASDVSARIRQAEMESAAITGFTSAIAAFGAFFIPKAYGTSIQLTGGVESALWAFLIFYVSCLLITWGFYTRRGGMLYDIERRPPAAPMPPAVAARPA
jgi:NNP family nitrate/nitrite transporter-like MFS transporter